MSPTLTTFLMGLAVGSCLLSLGAFLGYWFGRKSGLQNNPVDRKQFLSYLRELSDWTSEFSGDVSKYQSQLSSISDQVQGNGAPPKEELLGLLAKIMHANQQLQSRLDNTEEKLETQKVQISNYLTEARTDGLTGLMNRRAFDKAIEDLLEQWKHKHQPFSLGLIDIDHFKHINDNYGHPAGDAVLKHISRLLSEELDAACCIARYGGEEFAMLSTESLNKTSEALDRLRGVVGNSEFEHEGVPIRISMSAGASVVSGEDRIGRMVRRADEALYAAKLGGRNRVYQHDGTVCRLVTQVSPLEEAVGHAPPTEAQEQANHVDVRVQERLKRIVEEESRRVIGR